MKTTWGEGLNPASILPEYPRPQMRRESYICLNGPWRYAIAAGDEMPLRMEGEILVPFSPESQLSGVGETLRPGQSLWYRREFILPEGFNIGRVLLHFGAVDQTAVVYINGREAGRHGGGYTPFTLDITAALQEKNLLTVKVQDNTEQSVYTRGKQSGKPGGIWYTAQSGIWQTVWLESVPQDYIAGLFIKPLFDESALELTVCAHADGLPCTARVGDIVRQGVSNQPFHISMQGFTPWTPEHPHLYGLTVKMGEDQVQSYFGMRKVTLEKDEQGMPRIFLNGAPYFQSGVLDQGYWPDGLYTAPSDEAMIHDIETMKDLGFNMLRKHVKVEPLRWYYHCDRLGMLVWQDMPNGGSTYKKSRVVAPLFTGRNRTDDDYAAFGREDPAGREAFLREMEAVVATLYNSPCVVVWVPFNEGWGQFDAAKITEQLRDWDDSRLIDHASGWHDQGAGDIKSCHTYFKRFRFRQDSGERAVALTEFGGYGLTIAGHAAKKHKFSYKTYQSSEALGAAWRKLYMEEVLPAVKRGLCAAVYTQLSDVEGERNGILTWDRAMCKISAEQIRSVNGMLRSGWTPGTAAAPQPIAAEEKGAAPL